MSEADDLGDFEDDATAPAAGDIALEVLNEKTEAPADPILAAFNKARDAAMAPKPKMAEMIEAVSIVAGELEDAQLRLMLTRANSEPYQPYMRRAAALLATRNFLLLCQSKPEAVRRALGGNS